MAATEPTQPTSDAPPPIAQGKAPRLSDADLDALAKVGPKDVVDAVAWWKAHAPAAYRGLIDAPPADGG